MLRRRSLRLILAAWAVAMGGVAAASCGFRGEAGTDYPPPPDKDVQEVGASLPESGKGDSFEDLDGGNDANDAGPQCTSKGGPMVVALHADGTSFCIDATEVTNTAYDAFLAAIGDAGFGDAGPPPNCSGYSGFARKIALPVPVPADPVDRITWCDALAYCRWAGKRLCGKVVAGDAATGEWYEACSAGGTRVYPYGNSYDAAACNSATGALKPIGSMATCEGGIPGLVDMAGNAAEWINECNALGCGYVGGFHSSFSDTMCSSIGENNLPKSQFNLGVGVRCCDDPR